MPFFALLCLIALSSCETKKEAKTDSTLVKKDSVVVKKDTPFANPAYIYGSNFMSFMQSLRKIGNFDMMVSFTSSADVKKYGKDKIKAYFENKFTNMSTLKLNSVVDNSDGTKTLNYTNMSVATKKTASVLIKIEHDSCKVVLPKDLSKTLLN